MAAVSPNAKKLLEKALELPDESRAELAAALIESLDERGDSADEVESSWSAEIERRIRDVESGAVKPIPWEEARRIIFGDGPSNR
jgi:putative addiction module component (TIGR02574 family)